jgi:hypothetical protein
MANVAESFTDNARVRAIEEDAEESAPKRQHLMGIFRKVLSA